ncbi:MAG: 30S ribosomal protein S20 [Holosporales bacterium]|jgi:small subunit ribosomal protein S20|nr:30S ribosomal protein S20 [Holosporales bacterium]
MANHKSVIKRIRQNAKRNKRNHERAHRVKTVLTKFSATLVSGVKEDIASGLRVVQSELMKAVSKGVLVKKAASRSVSRLTKKAKSILG